MQDNAHDLCESFQRGAASVTLEEPIVLQADRRKHPERLRSLTPERRRHDAPVPLEELLLLGRQPELVARHRRSRHEAGTTLSKRATGRAPSDREDPGICSREPHAGIERPQLRRYFVEGVDGELVVLRDPSGARCRPNGQPA